jgi:transcriptional regulator CtsR
MEQRSLVSAIEAYIKSQLTKSPEGSIELRRKDIAQLFDCVPSQVTYVIKTRFGLRNGYVVQSRRGGFIKICSLFRASEGAIEEEFIGKKAEQDGRAILCTLSNRGFFTKREFLILGTALEVLEKELPDGEGGKLMLQIFKSLADEGFF